MSILKTEYRIEVWQDVWNGTSWDEVKSVVVGAHDMEFQGRAFDPILVRNANGEIKFSFKLYNKYIDSTSGVKEDNYLIPYLFNESKIKLYCPKYDDGINGGWFDFVIKEVRENRGREISFEYVCQYLPIHELTKTGQSLVFSMELENSVGTIRGLSELVLDNNTGWSIGQVSADLTETTEETLFKIITTTVLNLTGISTVIGTPNNISDLPSGSTLYIPYSEIDSTSDNVQVIYIPGTADDLILAKGNVISNKISNYTILRSDLGAPTYVATNYRGYKIVTTNKTEWNNDVKKYVTAYEKAEYPTRKYYGYKTTEVVNNPVSFNSANNTVIQIDNDFFLMESVVNYNALYSARMALPEDFGLGNVDLNHRIILLNEDGSYSTLSSTSSGMEINGVEKQVLVTPILPDGTRLTTQQLSDYIREWEDITQSDIFLGMFDTIEEADAYAELIHNESDLLYGEEADYLREVSQIFIVFSQISNKNGLTNGTVYYLKNITKDSFQVSLTPNGAIVDITMDGTGTMFTLSEAEAKEVQHYFYYNAGALVTADNETGLTPVLIPNSEKYRTLEAEKSNRFNLLQSIAELFKVWARFDITHDSNGKIQSKQVSFVDTIGSQNWAGFTYGVNLTGITRNIISTGTATKMFVGRVDNDNLEDGYCSISLSNANISGEEFLINLDYYAQVGLINSTQLIYDLYDVGNSTGIGYLSKLGVLNDQSIAISELDTLVSTYIQAYTDKVAAIKILKDSIQEEIQQLEVDYRNGITGSDVVENYPTTRSALIASLNSAQIVYDEYEAQLEVYVTQKANNIVNQTTIKNQKNALHNTFNNKYSRFIQEGMWEGGSTYIDHDAYYYDAQNVLLESSRPSVEYTINVVDLSSLVGYEDFNYQIGDITYIEDIEYFGFTQPDLSGNIRPYREQVIIAEIESNLDNPKNNKIVVRNYKNQFDELFQRITASVQSYNLNENIYARADNFTSKGELTFDALQTSLLNNSLILSKSLNEDVIINSSGMTLIDQQDSKKIVRAVSAGIFISDDGGTTWKTGITGDGINTNLLRAGQIDAAKINIISGSYPSFSWNSKGLFAYSYTTDQGIIRGIDSKKYVKFNQDGIKGVNKVSLEDSEGIDNTVFKLDWEGFYLKTLNGAVIIDSLTDSINVFQGSNDIVKLGLLSTGVYGLRVKNSSGQTALQIDSSGNANFKGSIEATGTITSTSNGYKVVSGAKDTYLIKAYNTTTNNILFSVRDTGDVVIGGNITLSGNITWSASNSPTKAVYARDNIAKPVNGTLYTSFPTTSSTEWHTSLDNINDNYVSYTYDAGTTWTATLLLQGQSGNGIKFAYLKTSTDTAPITPSGDGSSIPSGWTADPTGVDSTNKYEWISQSSYNGIDKTWSAWSVAALWSKYAVDGSDGAPGSTASVTRASIVDALLFAQPNDGIYSYEIGGVKNLGIRATAITSEMLTGKEIRVTGYGLGENSAYYIYNGTPNPSTNPPKGWLSYDVKGAGTSEEAANRVVLHGVDVLKIQSERNMSIGCVQFNNTTQKYETSPTYTMYAFGKWNFSGATVTGLTARFS